MKTITLFLILLPIFLLIDLIWLGVIMKSFYSAEFGHSRQMDAAYDDCGHYLGWCIVRNHQRHHAIHRAVAE